MSGPGWFHNRRRRLWLPSLALYASQETGGATGKISGAVGANEAAAQEFIPANALEVSEIALRLNITGAPTDSVTLDVVTGSDPSGTVVATDTVPVARISTVTDWIPFSIHMSMAAGTTYFLRLTRTGARDITNVVQWERSTTDVVSGSRWSSDSGVWSIPAVTDNTYRVYGISSGGAVVTIDTPGGLTLAGQTLPLATTAALTAGAITLAGQTLTSSTTVPVTAGALTLQGQTLSTKTTAALNPGAITLTGQVLTVTTTVPLTAGALTLNGQTLTVTSTGAVALKAGAITLTGQTITPTTTVPLTAGALTLNGQALPVTARIVLNPGAVTFAGQALGVTTTVLITAGAFTLNGQALQLKTVATLTPGALTLTGQTLTVSRLVPITAGALQLAGQTLALRQLVNLGAGGVVFTGQDLTAGVPPTGPQADVFKVYLSERWVVRPALRWTAQSTNTRVRVE